MADYSRSYTRQVRTSGDLLINAGDDIDIICSNNLTATINNKISMSSLGSISLNAGGTMTLYDASKPSGVTLANLQQEVIQREVWFNGQVNAGNNGTKLDAFEQTFVGTHANDYLEIWLDLHIQDSAGTDALNWTMNLHLQRDGGGYSLTRAYNVNLAEVNNGTTGVTPPFSLPLSAYYIENIGTQTVATRLIQSNGGNGEVLNSASSFRMKHSTKYYTITEEESGSWTAV